MSTPKPPEPPLTAAEVRRLWKRLKAAEELLVVLDRRLATMEERGAHFASTWINPGVVATATVPIRTFSGTHYQ